MDLIEPNHVLHNLRRARPRDHAVVVANWNEEITKMADGFARLAPDDTGKRIVLSYG